MRQFNELSALWKAPLFSRAVYQDAAKSWRGIGLRLLLLLELLTWLVILIPATVGFSGFLKNEAPAALMEFPPITITNGVASSDVPQPYVMHDDKGKALFVFDTTGAVTTPQEAGVPLLMTGTEIVQVNAAGVVERRPLASLPNMQVDQAKLLGWMGTFRNLMVPGGLLVCGGGSTAMRLILALLLAAIGLAFNAGFGGGLSYAALLRLTMLSMVGPVLLNTVLSLLGVPWTCLDLIVFPALTLGYLAYGVKVASAVVPRAGSLAQTSELPPTPEMDGPFP